MKRKMVGLLVMMLTLAVLAGPSGAEMLIVDKTPDADPTPLPSDGFAFIPSGAVAGANPSADGTWPKTIVITVGGDCTLGTTDTQRASSGGFDAVVRENGYAWPFSELSRVFGADDLTLVNFEGTLTDSTDKVEKKFNFKGPADYAQMLTQGSVEAVNLANNHFIDYGEQGEADTMAALDAYGIAHCAEGRTAIYEAQGIKIGLIGNTFAYKNGKCDISGDVKALREAGCQIVVASFHWGSEYKDYTRDQRNIGMAAIDAGADVVVGHHPHIIQPIERYKDTYILYSLGNLVFGGNMNPDDRDTFIAQFTFTVHEDGTVDAPAMRLYPMRLTSLDKGTDYRPVFAEGEESERIMKKILNRSINMEGFINPD